MALQKIGRPKADNPVDIRFTVCLDKNTSDKLDGYCEEKCVTKSVAIRRGLDLLFADEKK